MFGATAYYITLGLGCPYKYLLYMETSSTLVLTAKCMLIEQGLNTLYMFGIIRTFERVSMPALRYPVSIYMYHVTKLSSLMCIYRCMCVQLQQNEIIQ